MDETEDNSEKTPNLEARDSPDLVQRAIDMLYRAIKYHLGYERMDLTRDRNGDVWEKMICTMLRFKHKQRKLGFEKQG